MLSRLKTEKFMENLQMSFPEKFANNTGFCIHFNNRQHEFNDALDSNSNVIGCFHLKVGVKESIVNAPLVSLQSKNTNNAKSEVSFKQLIRDAFTIDSSTPTEVKFKKNTIPYSDTSSSHNAKCVKKCIY
jgi:hypothetical protein